MRVDWALDCSQLGLEEIRREGERARGGSAAEGSETFYRRRDHLICSLADCRTCEGNRNRITVSSLGVLNTGAPTRVCLVTSTIFSLHLRLYVDAVFRYPYFLEYTQP